MKKTASRLLALALLLGSCALSGCGGRDGTNRKEKPTEIPAAPPGSRWRKEGRERKKKKLLLSIRG